MEDHLGDAKATIKRSNLDGLDEIARAQAIQAAQALALIAIAEKLGTIDAKLAQIASR